MTAKTRWTFAVRIPLLSCVFLYASASGANHDNGFAATAQHLNESPVALRYQAAGSVGVGARVAKEPERAVLETAAPNRASRNFSDQTALVLSYKDIGEPTQIPVNATLPEKERLAEPNDGGQSVVREDFKPSLPILGLALVAFVLYSRRRADS